MSLGRFLPMFMLMAWAVRADAQRLPEAPPESVGLSSERLELVTRGLQKHLDDGDIAGVVGAVVRHRKLVYEAIVDDD